MAKTITTLEALQKSATRYEKELLIMPATSASATLQHMTGMPGLLGNGYRQGNGGDLQFLGKAYRKLHNLGEPRKRRPWFNKSWYISVEVLKDHMARIMGDEFSGAFDTLTERERG